MFKSVDIIEELSKERQRLDSNSNQFLESALDVLNNSFSHEEEITRRLTEGTYDEFRLSYEQLDKLDYSLIFNENVIQNIATKYRLRFLDSKLYVGTIPHEAKLKIRKIEENIGVKFKNFKVLAPASRFKLADSTEDPILFANLGNGAFYMIHKWGDDMNWYRNAIHFPFRNITTLALTCISLAMLINLFIPTDLFNSIGSKSIYHSLMLKAFFGFILAGLFFVASLIVGIMSSKEFSQDSWNSKYFN